MVGCDLHPTTEGYESYDVPRITYVTIISFFNIIIVSYPLPLFSDFFTPNYFLINVKRFRAALYLSGAPY